MTDDSSEQLRWPHICPYCCSLHVLPQALQIQVSHEKIYLSIYLSIKYNSELFFTHSSDAVTSVDTVNN